MKNYYTTIVLFLFAVIVQAQTFEFSLSFIGTNSGTNNYQVALVATPSASVIDGNTADMGAGFYIPAGYTIGNFEVGNSNLPATEWVSQSMGSNANGDAYFLSRTEGGSSSTIIDGSGPFQLVLFDIIADPNPTSGSVTFVENGDPIFNSLFVQNYINININSAGTSDAYSQNNPSANSIDFSVLSTNEFSELEQSISIYPNPASEYITISSTLELTKVELFDLLGKRVLDTLETSQIKIKHLPTGLYLIKVHATNGTLTKKIIIE